MVRALELDFGWNLYYRGQGKAWKEDPGVGLAHGERRINFCSPASLSFPPHPKILYIWSAPKPAEPL